MPAAAKPSNGADSLLLPKSAAQSEVKMQVRSLKRNKEGAASQERGAAAADNQSSSNYSGVKLGLGGLKHEEVTTDSLVTETDLNTLNTNKIAAVVGADKASIPNQHKFLNSQAGSMLIRDTKNVIAEAQEEQNEPESKQNNSVVIGALNRIAEH